MSPHLHLKTRILLVIVIVANVIGNAAMGWGLKSRGTVLGDSVLEYLRVFLNPWVAAGVLLLILWLLSRMALLSWADLSYVLPLTSAGYALNAVAGWLLLGEHVSLSRWAGTLLIVAGTALVSSTAIRTSPVVEPEPEEVLQ